MSKNKFDSIWNDKALLDAMIDLAANGVSNRDMAKQLTAKFHVIVTHSAISGKIGRLQTQGMTFPERKPHVKGQNIPNKVKAAISQDLQDEMMVSVIAQRNGVSEKYVRRRRAVLNESSDTTPEVSVEDLKTPSPPAVILPFDPPEHRITKKTCEFLYGQKKPWLRCTNPTAYHTPWCNEHGKKVFLAWPPKNYQNEDKQYG